MRATRTAGCVALGAVLLGTSAARAQTREANAPGWAFGAPAGEAALGAGCVLSLAAYFLPQRATGWGPAWPVAHHEAADRASDLTGAGVGAALQLGGGWVLEAAYGRENGALRPGLRALRASLVDVESVALATGITVALKRVAGRCRPRAWIGGRCVPDAGGPAAAKQAHEAFPSGHTSPIAAIAGARLALSLRSDGASGLRWASFGLAEGATVVTAVLRVLAGAHSWDDVLGGWAIGHATGALVSLAHPMESSPLAVREAEAASPIAARWAWSF